MSINHTHTKKERFYFFVPFVANERRSIVQPKLYIYICVFTSNSYTSGPKMLNGIIAKSIQVIEYYGYRNIEVIIDTNIYILPQGVDWIYV